MTRFGWIFILGLLAGCGDDGDTKTGCTEACVGETPHCDTERDRCVACLTDGHCAGGEVCVPTATGASCGECRTEADCGGGHCLEGRCIECTVASEAADCGVFSCDPQMNVCTGTQRGSLGRLEPCRADSECEVSFGYACVMTRYDGVDDGTHCLRAASHGCLQPLMTVTSPRVSVSWATAEPYCGFNETSVSAEAVRAMMQSRACESEADGETCGLGGLCRNLQGVGMQCTIPCGTADACPSDGPAAGCNGGGYCGTPG
jgi:hypothetical protein